MRSPRRPTGSTRHRAQVAVRDHDALGAAGRAARVEEPRRIVACTWRRFGARRAATLPCCSPRHRIRRRARAPARPGRIRTSAACHAASTNAQRAPLSASTYASSRGCSFALTGTATRPAHQQPNSASMIFGHVARDERDAIARCEARALRARRPAPRRARRAPRSREPPARRARSPDGAASCARCARAATRGCAPAWRSSFVRRGRFAAWRHGRRCRKCSRGFPRAHGWLQCTLAYWKSRPPRLPCRCPPPCATSPPASPVRPTCCALAEGPGAAAEAGRSADRGQRRRRQPARLPAARGRVSAAAGRVADHRARGRRHDRRVRRRRARLAASATASAR